MTESDKPWTYYLQPIWIGTGIGIGLGLLIYVIGLVFNAQPSEHYAWAEGLTGGGGGYSSTSAVPEVIGAWGFGLGLLVAIRRRVLRDKRRRPNQRTIL